MKRKKGLFCLIHDCDSYTKKSGGDTIQNKNNDFIEDAIIVKSQSVQESFYDDNEPISMSYGGEAATYVEEQAYEGEDEAPYEEEDTYGEGQAYEEDIAYEQPYEEDDESYSQFYETEDEYEQAYEVTEDDYDEAKSYTEDLGDDYYVEPFEEKKQPPVKPKIVMPGEQKEDDMLVRPGDDAPIPLKKKPVSEEEKLKETIKKKDKEFMDDLKSILHSKKGTSGNSKTEDDGYSRRKEIKKPQKQQDEEDENENVLQSVLKNEHQIFDKIAKSMKMANSYDLGSIALEQRFDSFDREMGKDEPDEEPRDEIIKKKITSTTEIADGELEKEAMAKDLKLETSEFLADLDKMVNPSAQGKLKTQEIPSPTDAGKLETEVDPKAKQGIKENESEQEVEKPTIDSNLPPKEELGKSEESEK